MRLDRQHFLGPSIVLILALLLLKVAYISFGLPYTTHADEATILRDPLKIFLSYSHGDFSTSTNLYNWLILFWLTLVFISGLAMGRWSTLDGFQEYIIAEPPYSLIEGRILSMLLGLVAAWILIRFICRITSDNRWRWLLSALVVFNPIEVNATNWIKFDAPAYLMYALLIYLGYLFFVEQRGVSRILLYVVGFIGVSVRIEVVAYLAGFMAFDFFVVLRGQSFWSRIVTFTKPVFIGVIAYSLITLVPFTWLYKTLHPQEASHLVTTPTFEKAIISKMPGIDYLKQTLLYSDFYFKCLLALLGPVVLYFFIRYVFKRQYAFLLFPFVITSLVLLIFPVKSVHYLLNVSLLLLIGSVFFLAQEKTKVNVALAGLSLLWTLSFCLSQAYVFVSTGDVRLAVQEYLLVHSRPDDLIYVEGSFSQIYDKPARYAKKAEAARTVGSTGLSNEYLSSHLDDQHTRRMLEVTDWEYFEDTPYKGMFGNNYDTVRLLRDKPLYYVLVTHISEGQQFVRKEKYKVFTPFYESVKKHYHVERVFKYADVDPRLCFVNYYYLNEVMLYRRNDAQEMP